LRIINKHVLGKLIGKNRGNARLVKSVEQLIFDIEKSNWQRPHDLIRARADADCVYGGEFYFFDINIHRAMILIVFEDREATVIWAGSHDEYDKTFKGNKTTIEKWLRVQKLI